MSTTISSRGRGGNWRSKVHENRDLGRIRFKLPTKLPVLTFYPLHKGRNTNGGSDTPVYTFPGSPICRYWKAGNCTKAEQCQFRHDPVVSQDSHSVQPLQNMTSAEEAEEATKGNWRLRAARRQKENDAGNNINVELASIID